MINSVSRKDLCKYITEKSNNKISYNHICSVVAILFDELIQGFIRGEDLKIDNFCVLSLKKHEPMFRYNVRLNRMATTAPYRQFHFKLNSKIANLLMKHVDIERTCGGIKKNAKKE